LFEKDGKIGLNAEAVLAKYGDGDAPSIIEMKKGEIL